MPKRDTVDFGDLQDAYSLGECDMQWMLNAITDMRRQIVELKKEAESGTALSGIHFESLITRSEMYEYLADNRKDYYTREAQAYEEEWEAFKRSNQS